MVVEYELKNEKYKCPCCGYYTLPGAGAYDICPVCFWEDDPLQEDDPEYEGGANDLSLIECTKIRINGTPVPRERYKRFAQMVSYSFLHLLIRSKFLMFFPFISKRYDP